MCEACAVVVAGAIALSLGLGVQHGAALERVGGVDIVTSPDALAAAVPDVSMPAGALVAADGRELWSRDAETRRAMASTTKIMTAIVVLERAGLEDQVEISSEVGSVGESAADVRPGDALSVRQLLEAMLVKSGNDAALALAIDIGGDEAGFVDLMNAKAEELGLRDTHFTNSHGLDAEDHYTTAAELSVMARYAMNLPEFRRIVGLRSITLDGVGGRRIFESLNLMLDDYPGANGIKTGWTSDAGYCLVASAKREGVELIAVVLGTRNERARFDQAQALLDWGFGHYALRQPAEQARPVGRVPVADYLDVAVTALVAQNEPVAVFDLDGEIEQAVSLAPEIDAPVAAGDRVGMLSVTQGERLLAQVPLVAAEDVAKPGTFERARISLVRLWRRLFGGEMMAEPLVLGG
jgi:D-alanyl-D-alanine carboxypeptidase (penicillin-binding protein 5/6)